MPSQSCFRRIAPALPALMMMLSGCRSISAVKMYGGADLPPDRQVTLVIPWNVGVRSVDGLPAPAPVADEIRLLLKPGLHAVEARYVALFPTTQGNTEKVTSGYAVLTFEAKPGRTYWLRAQDPRTLEEARRYAAKVSFALDETDPPSGLLDPVPVPLLNLPPPRDLSFEAAASPDPAAPPLLDQLQALWDKASEPERQAFRERIKATP